MKMPRFTAMQHAAAVACVLAISLVLHGAFGLTGLNPISPASASGGDHAIILPLALR